MSLTSKEERSRVVILPLVAFEQLGKRIGDVSSVLFEGKAGKDEPFRRTKPS